MANTEFEDSVEATEFMEDITRSLKDDRLMNWARITDENYGTDSAVQLQEARNAYNEFMHTMYEVE